MVESLPSFPASNLAAADLPEVDDTFLGWIRPFLEGALAVNRSFRSLGGQDEAMLYLGVWQFLLSDLAGRRDLLREIGALPMRDGLSRICPREFPASQIAGLIEETGVPRETVRRKLARLVRDGALLVRDDGTIQVAAPREDILAIAAPAFALGRWMLTLHGWPPDALGEPRSLRSFVTLGRAYLAAYLSLLKSRRLLTGTITHVPLQLGVSLLNAENVEALLAREGPPVRRDFQTFVALSVRAFDMPCYLRKLADVSGLPLAEVRASCRRLSAANGLVTLLGNEALKIGGPAYSRDSIGDRRFYPEETRRALQSFTRRVLERAEWLANRTATDGSATA